MFRNPITRLAIAAGNIGAGTRLHIGKNESYLIVSSSDGLFATLVDDKDFSISTKWTKVEDSNHLTRDEFDELVKSTECTLGDFEIDNSKKRFI